MSPVPDERLVDDAVGRWSEASLGLEGRVLDVVHAPAGVLSTVGALVDPTAADVVQLAVDLVATMRVSPGCVGLAAPQVGAGAKVFCVDVSAHPKAREGCMSVPDFTGDVKRASRVVVRGALPGTGERVEVRAEAFEARALQHEIDHCDGLLFLDRVAGAHAVHPRKTYL